MLHKAFDLIEAKADASGSFVALASVFGNVDSVGDRMLPGSFSKTLENWRESRRPIPVIFSHQWDNPDSIVGKADPNQVIETEQGLEVHGQLNLSDNPQAKRVHQLMKDGLLNAWSFGYTVPKGGQEQKNGANEISEVDLIEVGPTLRGANSEAQLQAVKSALEEQGAEVEAGVVVETRVGAPWRTVNEVRAQENLPPLEDDGDLEIRPETLKQRSRPAGNANTTPALFPEVEILGAEEDILKAVWSAKFINDLPDSSFLYVAPGGDKDADGKTVPRSLRYFPYKDSSGTVDLPHLRNALARIPQSNLPEDVKTRMTDRARRILGATQSSSIEIEDRPDEEPAKAKLGRQDPLQEQVEEQWLDVFSH